MNKLRHRVDGHSQVIDEELVRGEPEKLPVITLFTVVIPNLYSFLKPLLLKYATRLQNFYFSFPDLDIAQPWEPGTYLGRLLFSR